MKKLKMTYRTIEQLMTGSSPSPSAASPSARFLPLCFFTSMLAFTACSTEEEMQPVNGIVNLQATQLALTVNGQGALQTRMTDDIVQEGADADLNKFRGISELHLIPFSIRVADGEALGAEPVTADRQRFGAELIDPRSGIGAKNTDLAINTNAKVYFDVMIPVGTNAFLCYAQATAAEATGQTAQQSKHQNGVLNIQNTYAQTPGAADGITFSLEPITTTADAQSAGEKLTTFLNSMYDAAAADWASVPLLSGSKEALMALNAGSSADVQEFVTRLYNSLAFAKDQNKVKDVLKVITDNTNVETGVFTNTDLAGYPANIGLPDGAAYITWVTTATTEHPYGHFEVATDKSNTGALSVDVATYTYPASLWYRANSRIHTSTLKVAGDTPDAIHNTVKGYFTTPDSWDKTETNVLNQTVGSDALFTPQGIVSVDPRTTIVAITNPLQYAVARLDAKVALSTAITAEEGKYYLEDNKKKIEVVDGTTFPVSGILIAGQNNVDWQFLPVTAPTSSTIYDNQLSTSGYCVKTVSAETDTQMALRTLVLETVKNATVTIALELVNQSGQDIVTGADDHIVPPGCKFYLIGQLDPKATTGVTAPATAHGKVFRQDQVTTVTFRIGDLKQAYNVIPDLTNPQLEFSLGVTDWKLSTPVGIELE